jgi:hypothetical protein
MEKRAYGSGDENGFIERFSPAYSQPRSAVINHISRIAAEANRRGDKVVFSPHRYHFDEAAGVPSEHTPEETIARLQSMTDQQFEDDRNSGGVGKIPYFYGVTFGPKSVADPEAFGVYLDHHNPQNKAAEFWATEYTKLAARRMPTDDELVRFDSRTEPWRTLSAPINDKYYAIENAGQKRFDDEHSRAGTQELKGTMLGGGLGAVLGGGAGALLGDGDLGGTLLGGTAGGLIGSAGGNVAGHYRGEAIRRNAEDQYEKTVWPADDENIRAIKALEKAHPKEWSDYHTALSNMHRGIFQ